MRLSMMPTTKKKLGSIGLFVRQGDGSVGGPGSTGSARTGTVGLPATPAPALSGARAAQLPQLQPPPEIVATRQERQQPDTHLAATARSIALPRTSRYAAAPQPTAAVSLPAQHFHPMQRTWASASDTARDPPRGHNAWEDSTVASMFGGNESRAASERLHVHHAGHSRHYSDAAHQRAQAHQPQLSRAQPTHDESLPFVIGENGMLKVLPPPSVQKAPDTAALPVSGPGGVFDDDSVKPDNVYHDCRQLYETPTKASGLRRTKLPYRDPRGPRSNASSDQAGPGYSPETQSLNLSPERAPEAGQHIDKVRAQERLTRDRERQREREQERERERERQRQLEQERELQHKRSTVFENLTPVEFDEPDYNDTKAAVIAPSSGVDPEALNEALERTPRASRHHPQPQQQQQSFPSHNNLLDEAPALGRAASRRLKQPPTELLSTSRKRRQSLDYNDAELHAMSYADLRGQAFDFDPQAAALQQTTVPAGGSLEERLEHYRTKGSMDQHEFLSRLSLDEWDEAGDWFLTRFGSVVQRLRQARQAKRQLVQRFEDEVAAREEAVRGKMEAIGRTLEDLRQEGQTMMQGKDMDLDS